MFRGNVEDVYKSVAGLALSEEKVVACRRRVVGDGQIESEVNKFEMTAQMGQMREWLAEWGVTHVAMRTKDVSWLPVLNGLYGQFEVLLVNAQHFESMFKSVSEMEEARSLARLLQNGLLQGDFVIHIQKEKAGMLWVPMWNPSDNQADSENHKQAFSRSSSSR